MLVREDSDQVSVQNVLRARPGHHQWQHRDRYEEGHPGAGAVQVKLASDRLMLLLLISDWFSGAKLSEKFGEMKEALTWLSVIAKKWQVILASHWLRTIT